MIKLEPHCTLKIETSNECGVCITKKIMKSTVFMINRKLFELQLKPQTEQAIKQFQKSLIEKIQE